MPSHSLAHWTRRMVQFLLLAAALFGLSPARSLAAIAVQATDSTEFQGDDGELRALDARVRAAPDDLVARRQRGLWHEAFGLDATAISDLNVVLAEDQADVDALHARGRAQYRANRPLRARLDFEAVLALRPDDLDALAWRGTCNIALGRSDRAVDDLARVYANGADPGYGLWLALAQQNLQRYEEAQVTLLALYADDQADNTVLMLLAENEVELAEYQAALDHLDDVEYPAPDGVETDIKHMRLRARAQRGLGDEEAAREADDYADGLERELRAAERALEAIGDDAPEEPTTRELLEGLAWFLVFVAAALVPLTLIALVRTRATEREVERVPRSGTHPRYDGPADELFRLYLQNVVLTLLTLGVYRFWAKVRATRFHHQHLSFADGRLDFHATGREKFVGFLKGLALLLPLGVALYFEHAALLEAHGPFVAQYGTTATFVLVMYALRPLILVAGQRFNLARTSWSNVRFRFDGRLGDAYRLYGRDALLILLTLGIYVPFHFVNVRRFKLHHTAIGDLRFDFRGQGWTLFWLNGFGMPLCYVTLGLAVPWFVAAKHRFWVENTRLDGRRLHSRLTAGMVFTVGAPAMLAVMLSLGLALPWALTRWRRLVTHTTHYAGEVDPTRVFAVASGRSSATAEGIGEAGDLLEGLGDIFGT